MSGDSKKHMVSNLSTVAVVSITSDVPLSEFTQELCLATKCIGETTSYVAVVVDIYLIFLY